MEKHPLHLKSPEFQTFPEVNDAVKREERLTGDKVPNDPSARIEAYMDRLEDVFLHPDADKRDRALDGHLFGAKQSLREKIHDAFIIKKENFPESYFELQKRVARERGQAIEEILDHVREQMMDTAIQDQKASLDAWIDYLSGPDAVYPAWFKWYAFTQVTKLSQFDKERGEFKKRTDSTVAPFPDIYREPLAQIADVYLKVKEDNKNLRDPEIKEAFSKKFPALYAELIAKSLAASMENREQINGQWIKYRQGNPRDAEALYESLENKGTGWCTAGHATAEAQIDSGDFYVYYTQNQDGEPVNPRLAIRMEGTDRIGEVRGVLPQQNVEPLLQETLEEKLNEFGEEADAYRKKSADMKHLTAVEQKINDEKPLTRHDLVFLYEINSSIQGFGYGKDPRVTELRSQRNPDEDMLVLFDCAREEIAHVPNQITESTKAYLGQLEPGIFTKVQEFHIEHVYTSFPEGRITMEQIEIGGKTAKPMEKDIEEAGMQMSNYARSMMKSKEFTTSKTTEALDLVRLTVADLGFRQGATTDQIYKRAEELGLELCPAEVGPHYRLQYGDQPMDEWIFVGMKQIAGPDGGPNVFSVERNAGGASLERSWAGPAGGWGSDSRFLFSLRKSEPEELDF